MLKKDNLEIKLDRYYEDLMDKLLEGLERQSNVVAEIKDMKKEFNKFKQDVADIKEDLSFIRHRLVSHGMGGSTGAPQNQPRQREGTQKQPETPQSPSKPKSLKDFLEEEVSIFEVSVLNAFIKATREIIKTNAREEAQFKKPRVELDIQLPISCAGQMNLERDGKGKGKMAICFEERCIEALAKAVLFIDDTKTVSAADCADVASEVCNQICGKSKILLKKSGFSFEIERPEVHTGTADELMKTLTSPKIALVFHYAKGLPFYVCFWG